MKPKPVRTGRRGGTADADPKTPESSPTTRSFTEASPDGFPTNEAELVCYCPECGAKLTAADHEDCPYFRGKQAEPSGEVVAIECGYTGKPRRRERKRS
jgi:hypothetical protein